VTLASAERAQNRPEAPRPPNVGTTVIAAPVLDFGFFGAEST